MPSDITPTPETALIEAYVRELAPSIHELSCGIRADGAFDAWFRLNPTSPAKQIVIGKNDYSNGDWNEQVQRALENANLE